MKVLIEIQYYLFIFIFLYCTIVLISSVLVEFYGFKIMQSRESIISILFLGAPFGSFIIGSTFYILTRKISDKAKLSCWPVSLILILLFISLYAQF